MDTLGELRSADANVSPASRRPNRSPASLARRAQADAARVDRRTPEERARRAAQERARVVRQRAEREAQEVGRKELAVEQLLERVHASSGSTVTANSRRLRSLRGDVDAESDDEVAAIARAVPVERFRQGGVGEGSGYAHIYTTSDGEKVPVSAAHHYAYRDARMWRFSAYEFARLFHVRKMTKGDREWHTDELAQQLRAVRAGRPCERVRLLPPHPLHDSHEIVPKAKLGIPAFAGAPPPVEPPREG